MEKIHRRAALRCVSAYRTVSTEALCVLARSPPIELLAEERAVVFKAKKTTTTKQEALWVKQEARRSLLVKWKARIAQSKLGQWTTHVLIRDLDGWMNRNHGQLNFHLTQVLSGHGCFNKYLHEKLRKVEQATCSHCNQGRDDGPQHTLFECEAWRRERDKLSRSLQEIGVDEALDPSSLVPTMLGSEEAWNQVSAFAATVMKRKMDQEWNRQMQNHAMAYSTPVYHQNPDDLQEEED